MCIPPLLLLLLLTLTLYGALRVKCPGNDVRGQRLPRALCTPHRLLQAAAMAPVPGGPAAAHSSERGSSRLRLPPPGPGAPGACAAPGSWAASVLCPPLPCRAALAPQKSGGVGGRGRRAKANPRQAGTAGPAGSPSGPPRRALYTQ